jgi:exonuclease SbcC
MKPASLSLVGFRGIRDGLGLERLVLDFDQLAGNAQLIAFAGANGRGKSTIMDNLHPYLVMPSRAGVDGLGAFSYYDHVYLPESEKVLVWCHAGIRYKTHLVFRLNGRRRTEAFLFREVAGEWQPLRLEEGTLSDGRVETYERAVAEVLGPADTFFTSVFSAQGRRPLSAFKNGEIKSLLADLLGLEEIRTQGARASETARLLKTGLAVLRTERAQAADNVSRLARQMESVGDCAAQVQLAEGTRNSAAYRLAQCQARLVQLEAQALGAGVVERRRTELRLERERCQAQIQDAARRAEEEGARLERRLVAVRQRGLERRRQHLERLTQLQGRRALHQRTLAYAASIERAARREGLAMQVVRARSDQLAAAMQAAQAAEHLKGAVRQCTQDVAAIEREAGQVALRHKDLSGRFGLAAAVPCAGTELTGRCQLLGDARQAQALLPAVDAQLAELSERKRQALEQHASVQAQLARLGGASERRNVAEHRLERAQSRLAAIQMTLARLGEIEQARAALQAVDSDILGLGAEPAQETEDEVAERREIEATRSAMVAEMASAKRQATAGAQAAELALTALPAVSDLRALTEASCQKVDAEQAVQAADQAYQAAISRQAQVSALQGQLKAAQSVKVSTERRAAHVERSLSQWNLLAKCLSNDGVIALEIDEAGPTLASIANELLLACYGPRFTLEVITQTETSKGELREGFDIVVHDGLRDESKSLRLVSGGERVWINECLTRAIALYLAGNTGRQYGTLFSDEADGALDAEHKRMFLAMKREVLRLGGYDREFFVSQTPELVAMADSVIDLDDLAVRGPAPADA